MTNMNIHNFLYFLEELEKNLREMDFLLEKELTAVKSMHILHSTMAKMCENWSHQQKHRP